MSGNGFSSRRFAGQTSSNVVYVSSRLHMKTTVIPEQSSYHLKSPWGDGKSDDSAQLAVTTWARTDAISSKPSAHSWPVGDLSTASAPDSTGCIPAGRTGSGIDGRPWTGVQLDESPAFP